VFDLVQFRFSFSTVLIGVANNLIPHNKLITGRCSLQYNEIKQQDIPNTGEYTITPFLICDGRGESLFYHTYIREPHGAVQLLEVKRVL
jgi:hypothetical protein